MGTKLTGGDSSFVLPPHPPLKDSIQPVFIIISTHLHMASLRHKV